MRIKLVLHSILKSQTEFNLYLIIQKVFNTILNTDTISLMVTAAGLESGIYNGPGFAPAPGHLFFCVFSASETGLLLVVKLGRNVVLMRAGVKIMHQSNARRP